LGLVIVLCYNILDRFSLEMHEMEYVKLENVINSHINFYTSILILIFRPEIIFNEPEWL